MNHLKEKLKQIPPLPGVYQMLDSSGRVIYIGKSKCLKKRVTSYFNKSPKQPKIEKMIFFIEDIDYLVTDTHLEARLLECQLIKEIQPYFNSQMKNDSSYFYLKVNRSNRSPALSIVPEREDHTFGPLRRKHLIQSVIDMFTHLFPLVPDDSSTTFKYHPLPAIMSPEDFTKNSQLLIQLFSEEIRIDCFINQLNICMHEVSAQYHFERATLYRDLIESLTYIRHLLHGYKHLTTSDILLKIPVGDGEKLFFISKGKIVLKKYFSSLSQTEIRDFIKEGSMLKLTIISDWNEKAESDFQNILFSEIQSLPEESILKLT